MRIKEIARALGRTPGAIDTMGGYLGLRRTKGRQWTQQDDAKLIQLFREGLKYREIGKRLGRTRYGIKARITKLGWDQMWGKCVSMREGVN